MKVKDDGHRQSHSFITQTLLKVLPLLVDETIWILFCSFETMSKYLYQSHKYPTNKRQTAVFNERWFVFSWAAIHLILQQSHRPRGESSPSRPSWSKKISSRASLMPLNFCFEPLWARDFTYIEPLKLGKCYTEFIYAGLQKKGGRNQKKSTM